jgi:hypothetical protein
MDSLTGTALGLSELMIRRAMIPPNQPRGEYRRKQFGSQESRLARTKQQENDTSLLIWLPIICIK